MDARELAIVRGWLETNRGAMTQGDLASAITAATGWNIDRTRYSKYESGPLGIGPTVLGHFVDYWKSRGVDGPDLTPESAIVNAPVDPLERIALAVEDIARTLGALRGDMAEQRGESAGAIERLEASVAANLGRIADAR